MTILLASLAALLTGIALLAPPDLPAPAAMAILGVLAVGFELAALRLPVLGLVSPAGALYVAAALLVGPRGTLFLALAALTLRSLTCGAATPGLRLRETLQDLVPALGAAAGARLGQPLGPYGPPALAFQLYLGLSVLARYRSPLAARLFPLALALGSLGLVLSRLTPVQTLLAVPVLLFFRWALQDVLWREEERQRHALERDLARTQSELDQRREAVDRLRTDLSGQVEDVSLLVELSRELSQAREPRPLAERLLQLLQKLVSCRTVALFVPVEGRLEPLAFRSPDRERLESFRLLDQSEVLLEEALSGGRAVEDEGAREPRLLPEEPCRLCLPLDGLAVLYVGRPHPFRPRESHLVEVIAGQAAQAWQSAVRFGELRSALDQTARANQRLESWMEGIELVLDAMRRMTASLDPALVLAELEKSMGHLVPHQSHLVVEDGVVLLRRGEAAAPPELLEAVQSSGKPLLLEDVAASRFAPLAPGERSLLAVPLLGETGPRGVVLLGSPEQRAFRRSHQDQLFLLAFLATSVLKGVRLHAEAVEAYRKLADSEAQLVQSSKLAAVGQLAAGLAHELNTPLAALLVSLDAAARYLPDRVEQAQKRLEKAAQAVLRSQSLVEKLLYYSRDGRSARVPVDLNEVARDALELLAGQLGKSGARVELRLQPLPQIPGSPQELQQVVTNLLLNARDAQAEAGRLEQPIVVESGPCPRGVFLSVTDHGPGVAPENQARLFDPFFTTKPIGQGTGLGLSVSQQITRAHEGELSFSTTPGEGSTFRLELPGTASAPPTGAGPQPAEA